MPYDDLQEALDLLRGFDGSGPQPTREEPTPVNKALGTWGSAYAREHEGNRPGQQSGETSLEALANLLWSQDFVERAGRPIRQEDWVRHWERYSTGRDPEWDEYLSRARSILDYAEREPGLYEAQREAEEAARRAAAQREWERRQRQQQIPDPRDNLSFIDRAASLVRDMNELANLPRLDDPRTRSGGSFGGGQRARERGTGPSTIEKMRGVVPQAAIDSLRPEPGPMNRPDPAWMRQMDDMRRERVAANMRGQVPDVVLQQYRREPAPVREETYDRMRGVIPSAALEDFRPIPRPEPDPVLQAYTGGRVEGEPRSVQLRYEPPAVELKGPTPPPREPEQSGWDRFVSTVLNTGNAIDEAVDVIPQAINEAVPDEWEEALARELNPFNWFEFVPPWTEEGAQLRRETLEDAAYVTAQALSAIQRWAGESVRGLIRGADYVGDFFRTPTEAEATRPEDNQIFQDTLRRTKMNQEWIEQLPAHERFKDNPLVTLAPDIAVAAAPVVGATIVSGGTATLPVAAAALAGTPGAAEAGYQLAEQFGVDPDIGFAAGGILNLLAELGLPKLASRVAARLGNRTAAQGGAKAAEEAASAAREIVEEAADISDNPLLAQLAEVLSQDPTPEFAEETLPYLGRLRAALGDNGIVGQRWLRKHAPDLGAENVYHFPDDFTGDPNEVARRYYEIMRRVEQIESALANPNTPPEVADQLVEEGVPLLDELAQLPRLRFKDYSELPANIREGLAERYGRALLERGQPLPTPGEQFDLNSREWGQIEGAVRHIIEKLQRPTGGFADEEIPQAMRSLREHNRTLINASEGTLRLDVGQEPDGTVIGLVVDRDGNVVRAIRPQGSQTATSSTPRTRPASEWEATRPAPKLDAGVPDEEGNELAQIAADLNAPDNGRPVQTVIDESPTPPFAEEASPEEAVEAMRSGRVKTFLNVAAVPVRGARTALDAVDKAARVGAGVTAGTWVAAQFTPEGREILTVRVEPADNLVGRTYHLDGVLGRKLERDLQEALYGVDLDPETGDPVARTLWDKGWDVLTVTDDFAKSTFGMLHVLFPEGSGALSVNEEDWAAADEIRRRLRDPNTPDLMKIALIETSFLAPSGMAKWLEAAERVAEGELDLEAARSEYEDPVGSFLAGVLLDPTNVLMGATSLATGAVTGGRAWDLLQAKELAAAQRYAPELGPQNPVWRMLRSVLNSPQAILSATRLPSSRAMRDTLEVEIAIGAELRGATSVKDVLKRTEKILQQYAPDKKLTKKFVDMFTAKKFANADLKEAQRFAATFVSERIFDAMNRKYLSEASDFMRFADWWQSNVSNRIKQFLSRALLGSWNLGYHGTNARGNIATAIIDHGKHYFNAGVSMYSPAKMAQWHEETFGFVPDIISAGFNVLGMEQTGVRLFENLPIANRIPIIKDVPNPEVLASMQVHTGMMAHWFPELYGEALAATINSFDLGDDGRDLFRRLMPIWNEREALEELGRWANDFGYNDIDELRDAIAYAHKQSYKGALAAANEARNITLLNYGDKTFLDPFLDTIFPYQYWFTRSLGNWVGRLVDNPRVFSMYRRIEDTIAQHMNSEEDPEWLRRYPSISKGALKRWREGENPVLSAIGSVLLANDYLTGNMDDDGEKLYFNNLDKWLPLRSVFALLGGDAGFEKEIEDDRQNALNFALQGLGRFPAGQSPLVLIAAVLLDRMGRYELDRTTFEASIPFAGDRIIRAASLLARDPLRERLGIDVGPRGFSLNPLYRQLLGYRPYDEYEYRRQGKFLADAVRTGKASVREALEALVAENRTDQPIDYSQEPLAAETAYRTSRLYGDRGLVSALTGINPTSEPHQELRELNDRFWDQIEASGFEKGTPEYNALFEELIQKNPELLVLWAGNEYGADERVREAISSYLGTASKYGRDQYIAERYLEGADPDETMDQFYGARDLPTDQALSMFDFFRAYFRDEPQDEVRARLETTIETLAQERFPGYKAQEREYFAARDRGEDPDVPPLVQQAWDFINNAKAQSGLFELSPEQRQMELDRHPPSEGAVEVAGRYGISTEGKTNYEVWKEIRAKEGEFAQAAGFESREQAEAALDQWRAWRDANGGKGVARWRDWPAPQSLKDAVSAYMDYKYGDGDGQPDYQGGSSGGNRMSDEDFASWADRYGIRYEPGMDRGAIAQQIDDVKAEAARRAGVSLDEAEARLQDYYDHKNRGGTWDTYRGDKAWLSAYWDALDAVIAETGDPEILDRHEIDEAIELLRGLFD